MHDQLAGTFHAPGATKFRVIGQSFSLLRKQLVKSCCRRRIIRLNIVENSIPIRNRFRRPTQLHNSLSSLRRVSALRAANFASTSSFDTRFPALAESSPNCTCSRNQSPCSSASLCRRNDVPHIVAKQLGAAPVPVTSPRAVKLSFSSPSTRKVNVAWLMVSPRCVTYSVQCSTIFACHQRKVRRIHHIHRCNMRLKQINCYYPDRYNQNSGVRVRNSKIFYSDPII